MEYGEADHWTLAGGLTPQTVAKAIAATGAKSVDVASGVEQPRGVKSSPLIQSFVDHSQSLR
jgi:phosphoribosylanthranilate isomerase